MNKEEYWRRQIVAYERSGLGVADYCKREGIKDNRIFYWRARLREKKPEFAAVGQPAAIEIELPGGARLKLPTSLPAETLQRILEAVNALAC